MKIEMKFSKLQAMLFALIFSTGSSASVFVNISNIREIKGNLMIGVYKSQNEIEKRKDCKDCKGFKEIILAHEASVEIKDLQPGWYMIAIYQDLNSNENLDANFMGIPIEPYGFSLNRMGMFGPSFEKSKFYYDGKNLNLDIKIN